MVCNVFNYLSTLEFEGTGQIAIVGDAIELSFVVSWSETRPTVDTDSIRVNSEVAVQTLHCKFQDLGHCF